MNIFKIALVAAVVFAAVAAGQETREPAQKLDRVVEGSPPLYMAGPFTHKNLAIYILYLQESPDVRKYITLDEGLKSGKVKITERQQEQVSQLLVSNLSDDPLFLQVGELLRGGKQDRTLKASIVIPPHIKEAIIPSLCVEQTRWSGGREFSTQGINAPKDVRVAAARDDQREVWSEVRAYKSKAGEEQARASGESARPSKTSSINEELQGKTYESIISDYEKQFRDVPSRFKNVVGLAYAVNGQVSTVDIYDSPELMDRLYVKLLRSAAAEAMAAGSSSASAPSLKETAEFIKSAWDGKSSRQSLGYENIQVQISGDKTLVLQLFYQKHLVHTQVVAGKPVKVVPPPTEPPITPLPRPRPLPMPERGTDPPQMK